MKEPKTKASRRTLPVTPELLAILTALREETRRATAEVYAEMGDPYILGTQEPDSKPYPPNSLSKDYRVFCEAHGFNLGQAAESGEELAPITLMLSAAQLESLRNQVLAALAQ